MWPGHLGYLDPSAKPYFGVKKKEKKRRSCQLCDKNRYFCVLIILCGSRFTANFTKTISDVVIVWIYLECPMKMVERSPNGTGGSLWAASALANLCLCPESSPQMFESLTQPISVILVFWLIEQNSPERNQERQREESQYSSHGRMHLRLVIAASRATFYAFCAFCTVSAFMTYF